MKNLSASYPLVKRLILGNPAIERTPSGALLAERLDKLLDYNVVGGKCIRGQALVDTARSLSPDASHSRLLHIHSLAWALEILQGMFLVSDDVMDNGKTRRGKACWHRLPGVGLAALNDSFLLDSSATSLVHSLSSHPRYHSILDAINETRLRTYLGQALDMERKTLEQCSPQLYAEIVHLKTTHYTISAPVTLALHVTEFNLSPADAGTLDLVCTSIGHLFQAQDDMLDWAGAEERTGKQGCDIAEGKLTWPLHTALTHGPLTKAFLQEHYGKDGKENVRAVLDLYETLDIRGRFAAFEEAERASICTRIDSLKDPDLKRPLTDLLEKLVKRAF